MPTPILFYSPGTCSLGALVAIEWVAKPYRLCRIDPETRGGEEYERLNPLGQVPLMMIGDRLLAQNMAILHHLGFLGRDLGLDAEPGTPEQDRLNEALGYLNSTFHTSFGPLFSPGSYLRDSATHEALRRQAQRAVRENYDYVERFLVPEGYLFGRPTIMEAYLFAMVRWGADFIDIPTEFPKIDRFQNRFGGEAAVRFALAIEKDGNADSRGGFQGHVELGEVVSGLGAGTLSHFKPLTSAALLRDPHHPQTQSQAV